MIRRTTIDLDDELVARAKRALGAKTTRATVEQALRRAAESAESNELERVERQTAYLRELGSLIDPEILRSGEMWR